MTEREDADHRYIELKKAIWLAVDILPVTNIDRAAKRLAREVAILEKELGRTPTKGEMKL
jgi:hypothetical protein